MSSDTLPAQAGATRSVRKLGPLLGVRVLRAFLWLLVFSGPALAGLGLLLVSDLAGRVDALSRRTGVEVPSDTGRIEGFAETFLASYLTGSAEDSPSGVSAGDVGTAAVRTVSLGAQQVDDGYFVVTVAAVGRADDPEPRDDRPPDSVDSLVYRLGVVVTDSGLVVVGPPSLVPAPAEGVAPELLVDRMDGLEGVAGLEEATVRFLAAYLTGEGELTRYTAPGLQLTPILPPPFVTVEILETGSVPIDESRREVVVIASGVDGSDRTQVLQFALVVGQRDGRWEVVDLLPAPSLAKDTE